MAALPPGAGLLGAGGAQWRQLAAALLALSSLAAVAGWLGYTPARLVQAAAQRLAAVDPAVLRAAGLQDVAAAVVQQAAAASAASGGEEEEEDDGTAVAWYCLEEKLQLYSSVLRLLTCASIQAHMRQEAAALQLPALASRSTASIHGDELQPAGAALAGAPASSSALARQQAMAALQQKQEQLGGGPSSIRGWRATAAGARSESQLLALAPSALQDMAVTAADAVAAAYLADAADAGPSAVARGAGAGEAAAAAAAQPVARQDGSEQQRRRRRRRGDRQQQAAALVALARDGTSSSGSGSSAPLEAGWWPTFVHRQLGSSRQLQRFCNAVQLQRWWHRQYQGVADMYEDRLRLWTLADGGRRLQVRPAAGTAGCGRWSAAAPARGCLMWVCCAVGQAQGAAADALRRRRFCSPPSALQPRLAPVKRTAELGRLRGLRYAGECGPAWCGVHKGQTWLPAGCG